MQHNIKAYNDDSSSNEFAALLKSDLDKRVTAESSLVNGIVSRIEEKIILIDVGLKSEGVINKSELTSDELETLKVGDELEVFIERLESKHGEVILDCPRDFDGLKEWLTTKDMEGIVFHHPDGRMCKIKKTDFGLKR